MAKSIVRSAARAALRRIRRDRQTVMREYDQRNWALRRESRAWERAVTLEGFLIGDETRRMTAKIHGRAVKVACNDYYRHRLTALGRLIREHLPSSDELVEIGCGYGYNLFALALALPDRRFIGLDISPNGVEMGRAIAAHFGLSDRVRFDFLDVTDGSAPNYHLLNGRSCLTFFCLEQIPNSIEQALRNILAAGPRRVLHVEPSTELLDLRRPSDWANYVYVRSMHYQSALFRLLRQMQHGGVLRVLATGRLPFSPTLQNDGFFAAWEPVSSSTGSQP